MSTRTLIRSLIALAAAGILALAGCDMGSHAGVGSMTFSMSPSARALGANESYRVEIYYGLDRYASQTSTVDGDIVFEGLPLGDVTVAVAQGSVVGDAFVAKRYKAARLTIVPGDNTPPPIVLEDVPFVAASLPEDAVGVTSLATLGDEVYYSTSSSDPANMLRHRSFGSGAFTSVVSPTVPDGVEVLSVSRASYFAPVSGFDDQIWVNTSFDAETGEGGIYVWESSEGDSLDGSISDGFSTAGNWAQGTTPSDFSVFGSGTFTIPGETAAGDAVAIFFERDGGMGGVYLTRSDPGLATPSLWPWMINDIDFQALIGVSRPILDFQLGPDALYAATVFTTLKVSSGLLDSNESYSAGDLLDPESGLVGFASGIPDTVVALAVDWTLDKVYLGTGKGLWVGSTSDAVNKFFAAAPREVSGTKGYAIRKIRVAPNGAHVAFLTRRSSAGPDFLGILHTEGAGSVVLYRSLQGLPGENLSDITWLDDATLLVGGNAGLAALTVQQ